MSLLFDGFKKVKGDSTEKVDAVTRNMRLLECQDCTIEGKKTVLPTGNCRICGCFVKEKTKYQDEKCPIGKW